MTEDLQVVQQKSQLAIPVIGHLVFWLRCRFLDCSARRDCWKAIALAELQPLRSNSVKNLFCGTGRSILRKGAEFTLVPVAEFVPRQAAHSGDLPQCGRMGSWYLWCRVGVSLLRRNRCPERRSRTGGAARCDSASSPEVTARAHEQL
jgi:hypothetical protein